MMEIEEIEELQIDQKEQIKECKVCYEGISDSFYLSLNCCKSVFHHNCLQECLYAQKNQNILPNKCPNFDCGKDITEEGIQLFEKEIPQIKKLIQNQPSFTNKLKNQLLSPPPNYGNYLNYDNQEKTVQNKIQPNQKKIIQSQNKSCDICYDDMDENSQLQLQCKHTYHKACLQKYFMINIESNKFPLMCPNQTFQHEIQPHNIKQVLNEKDYEKYEYFQFNFYIDYHKHSQLYQNCLTPDCNYVFIQDQNFVKFNCPSCYKEYCLKCNCEFHTNQTCEEYQKSEEFKKLEKQFEDFVKNSKYKQCSKCQAWVEKIEAVTI